MFNNKRYLIKNIFIIGVILLIACIATQKIYTKFTKERNISEGSNSLEIIYHQKTGSKVTLTKLTPVTDSVGLSSKEYSLTVKNKLTREVNYNVKLERDLKEIINDECGEYQIPENIIRVSIKSTNEKDKIYELDQIKNNILKKDILKPNQEKDYIIRLWVEKNTLPAGSNMHYHGNIKVKEVK